MPSQNSKQKTLFQAWNKKQRKDVKTNQKSCDKYTAEEVAEIATNHDLIDLTDDDLVEAAEFFECAINQENASEHLPAASKALDNVELLPGFDNSMGHIWIYPTNYPVRDYQFSIVKTALLKNTLVSLPTGLGKTFIAAVVMYNFYRWYPQGKIIFMAPTKPLVSQQIEACYKIMGIPMEDQAEITGMTTPAHKREALWQAKRVFFLTPQVINNDLARGVCPSTLIKCIVIDEAHKAQGNHAYCQVVNQLVSSSRQFRVLALSATPGTDVRSVQQVITNLLISHIEIRAEDSIDIQRYSHQRNVQKVVCKLDDVMIKMKKNFLKVIETFTRTLINRRVLFDRDVSQYSKYGLLMARDQYRKDPPSGLNKYEMGAIEGDFAMCISLYHALELLLQHGMRSFFIFLKNMMEGEKGYTRSKTVLGANSLFREIYHDLTSMFGNSPNPSVQFTQATQKGSYADAASQSRPYVYSHPKIEKLEEIVVKHFKEFVTSSENDATRVMVFCQYRDSVQEITELLQKHRPIIRPMQFVGHSTASGKVAKFTQKHQLQVVAKFREGGYNTLVSTCVGEEGLDIGDVDLIVCFDSHKSPIRLIQRMGRTGRKRKGRIVMLVTEGKEERDYNSSVASKKSIHNAITGNARRSFQFYPHNPRMVPVGFNPTPHKMYITIQQPSASVSSGKMKEKKQKVESADISVMLKKGAKRDSAFLNEQQLREWNDTMKLSAQEKAKVKKFLPGGQIMCLKKTKVNPSPRQVLSLSEWSLWQTKLNPSVISGHSRTTENFVEIMEMCDLIKESDHQNFEENLAPFFGAKYDRDKMREKRSDKIDKFLKPSEKQNFQGKLEARDPEKNLETGKNDSDLLKKGCDKTFLPAKSNFKEKLSLLAYSEETASQGKKMVDDTMFGIDSLLSDTVDESSKEDRNREDNINIIKNAENNTCNLGKDEFLPNSGKSDLNEKCEMLSGVFAHEHAELDLGIADNLSILSNEALEQEVLSTSTVEKSISTAPNLVAISVESMEDFRDPLSDCSETDEIPVKIVKRRCFTLSNDEQRPSEELSNADLKNDCDVSGTKLKEIKCETDKYSDSDEEMITKVGGPSTSGLSASVSNNNDESRGGNVNLDSSDDDVKIPLSQPQRNEPVKSVEEIKGRLSPEMLDMSADMFEPQFELDFDIDMESSPVLKTRSPITSPVLTNKRKSQSFSDGSMSKLENDHHCNDKAEASSLVQITLSQRVENRERFSSFPKFQTDLCVPVAKVIPQAFNPEKSRVTDDSKIIQNSEELTSDNEVFHQSTNSDIKTKIAVTDSSKRKRQSTETNEEFTPKRRKESNPKSLCLTGENSPFKSYSPDLSVPNFNMGSESSSSDDSAILIKRKRPNRKLQSKVLFSPDSTQSSVFSAALDETKKKSSIASFDSPVQLPVHSLYRSELNKHSTPKCEINLQKLAEDDDDNDFKIENKSKTYEKKKMSKKIKTSTALGGFLENEAEVSITGDPVSSDETEVDEADVSEEMQAFVNDATQLTQHVGDGSHVDEQAMYLRGPHGGKPSEFQSHNGRFKLAYGVGANLDVFSQDVPSDVSGYEEDSFVCNDEEVEDGAKSLGEITLLENVSQSKNRLTRRQAQLNQLRKINYEHSPAVIARKKNKKGISNQRRRIICMDDSNDNSFTSEHNATELNNFKTTWTCQVCTLLNPSTSQICELCDSEKPSQSGQSKDACDLEFWSCTLCTFKNQNKKDVCDMCNEARKIEPQKNENGEEKIGEFSKCKMTKPKRQETVEALSTPCSQSNARLKPSENSQIISATSVMKRQPVAPKTKVSHHIHLKQIFTSKQSTQCSSPDVDASPSTSASLAHEERLKRARQKQMEFRARMEKRRSNQSDVCNLDTPNTLDAPTGLVETRSNVFAQVPSTSKASLQFGEHSLAKAEQHVSDSNNTARTGKKVLLIDSKELSSCQKIITTLRSKHDVEVVVGSLAHCDYIVGNGTAVERKLVSDFSQASHRQKLVDRIRHLNTNYDRVYLILEKDRLKRNEGRQNAHSSYYHSTLCGISLANVRILHSDSQIDTADILNMLLVREHGLKRHVSFEAAQKANDMKYRSLLRLYSSIPKIHYVSALYLCVNFKSLKEVSISSVEKLMKLGHLSTYSAAEVYSYFRKKFDLQMTPVL